MTRFKPLSTITIVEALHRLAYRSYADSLLLGEAGSLAH